MRIDAQSAYRSLPSGLPTPAPAAGGTSFGDVLKQSISQVDQLQHQAEAASRQLAIGDQKDIHQTTIAVEKADIAMNLMLQIRNKLVTAFDEVRRMQV